MLAAFALMLSGCATTSDVDDPIDSSYGPYQEWDINNDGEVEDAEYSQRLLESRTYVVWDLDSDGDVDQNEYLTGVYYSWDANNDGIVDSGEFDMRADYWLEDDSRFEEFDMDGDDELSGEEMMEAEALVDYAALVDVDGDQIISEEEFIEATFNVWDADDDGVIMEDEYGDDLIYMGD